MIINLFTIFQGYPTMPKLAMYKPLQCCAVHLKNLQKYQNVSDKIQEVNQ